MDTTTQSTQPGDFETLFSLFIALETTADRWFDPERQMALMDGFDDFSGNDSGQVSGLLDVDLASPAEAEEALARLTELLQREPRSPELDIALRYTRALDAVQLLRTVGER